MKKFYQVTFKHSEDIYCVNIAIASSIEDIQEHYKKYEWFDVREAADYEVESAKRKHMPIVTV